MLFDIKVFGIRRLPLLMRQLFDPASCSYSYLIARRYGGEAVLIDPVLGQVEGYLRLLNELGVRLVKAIDTHLHADRFSGLGALRDRTGCLTAMSDRTAVELVSMRVADGATITVDGLKLHAIHTPGHTADSMSFVLDGAVFTGDTLLIRSTGRTDLPGGDAAAQYESIFGRLLTLPDLTHVYPAHDYNGQTASTIGEERRFNPYLQACSRDEYVASMNQRALPKPKLLEQALRGNLALGRSPGPKADEEALASPRRSSEASAPARMNGLAAKSIRLGRAMHGGLQRVRKRWQAQREMAHTISALRRLDARTLRDVGLDRSEAGSIAAELQGFAESTRRRTLDRSYRQ